MGRLFQFFGSSQSDDRQILFVLNITQNAEDEEMKENNGRVRRRRRIIYLLTRVGVVAFIIVVFVVCMFRNRGREVLVGRSRAERSIIRQEGPVRRAQNTHSNTNAETLILNGEWNLINIHIPKDAFARKSSSYHGVLGKFCPLNWSLYRENPSRTPFFKDLVSKSCQENTYSFDLKHILYKMRQRGGNSGLVQPSGFIFHESRCGSTLVSNLLAAGSIWHKHHFVYSEPTPLIHALQACVTVQRNNGDCNPLAVKELVRDVVKIMGHVDSSNEDKVFIKMQSMGTRTGLEIFSQLYPEVPWIFIYRHPRQVMMSYFGNKLKDSSVCARGYQEMKHNVLMDEAIDAVLERTLGRDYDHSHVTKEQYCAAVLASFCEAAIHQHLRTGMGRFVNYNSLKPTLLDTILPIDFGLPVGVYERTRAEQEVFSVYSKQKEKTNRVWVQDDSLEKEKSATEAVKAACVQFLWKSYLELERLAAESTRQKLQK